MSDTHTTWNDGSGHSVSIVIRTRNCARDLEHCLTAIGRQSYSKDQLPETIVVDNESTDDSADVARRFGCEVVSISRSEFSWGRALNWGIERAKGDVVILLSADVEPVNDHWLSEMITPFGGPQVATVYARQIPRSNAPVDERARLSKTFPVESKQFDSSDTDVMSTGRGLIASNACAAIRRSCWVELPYDEEIEGAEEVAWTLGQLRAGRTVRYSANAVVYHSHYEPATRHAYRIWELFVKNQRLAGRRTGIGSTLWAAGSQVKRRLVSLLTVDAPFVVRLRDFVRLPAEVGAFLSIAAIEGCGVNPKTVRNFMWK